MYEQEVIDALPRLCKDHTSHDLGYTKDQKAIVIRIMTKAKELGYAVHEQEEIRSYVNEYTAIYFSKSGVYFTEKGGSSCNEGMLKSANLMRALYDS